MKSKKKKSNSHYDSNGRWVEEKTRIKGAIRRMFRLSPQMHDVLRKARVELPPLKKKDGEDGKRPQVRYRCACCGELFSSNCVQVDHINPVVPFHLDLNDMGYDDMVRSIFCDIGNLQVLCSKEKGKRKSKDKGPKSCHTKKTAEENYLRKCWRNYKTTQKGPFSETEVNTKNMEFREKYNLEKQKAKK